MNKVVVNDPQTKKPKSMFDVPDGTMLRWVRRPEYVMMKIYSTDENEVRFVGLEKGNTWTFHINQRFDDRFCDYTIINSVTIISNENYS